MTRLRARSRSVVACVLLAIACVACAPTSVLPLYADGCPEAKSPTPTPLPRHSRAGSHRGAGPARWGPGHGQGCARSPSARRRSAASTRRQLPAERGSPNGAVTAATVTLDAGRRTATLTPSGGLTIATTYTASMEAGEPSTASAPDPPDHPDDTRSVSTGSQVEFPAGAYTGYQFGATTADTPRTVEAQRRYERASAATRERQLRVWMGTSRRSMPARGRATGSTAPRPAPRRMTWLRRFLHCRRAPTSICRRTGPPIPSGPAPCSIPSSSSQWAMRPPTWSTPRPPV